MLTKFKNNLSTYSPPSKGAHSVTICSNVSCIFEGKNKDDKYEFRLYVKNAVINGATAGLLADIIQDDQFNILEINIVNCEIKTPALIIFEALNTQIFIPKISILDIRMTKQDFLTIFELII